MGSGVRNIYKYSEVYSGGVPVFVEEDIFKTSIPLNGQATTQATMQVTTQATTQGDDYDRTMEIIEFCNIPRSRQEIQDFLKMSNREYFRKSILSPLIKGGLLKLTNPEKPTSPKQKYYSKQI